MKPSDVSAISQFAVLLPTFADYQHDVRVQALAEAAVCSPSVVEEVIWRAGFASACERGEYPLSDMLTGLRERLQADLTEAHLMGLWALAYEPDVKRLSLLARRAEIALVANGDPLLRAGLDAYLPEICTVGAHLSCEQGALITESAFFHQLSSCDALAQRTPSLFDDDPQVSAAARAAGWRIAQALTD